ncbi:MAG: dihydrofolate reductase [Bacteroidetes bacterium]|nr:dihydrofolate reductase [Bacteroidota bacterium]
MRRLSVFNFVTLNGYFQGLNGDISWHRHGGEEGAYASEMSQMGGTLLFGRVTYQMMEAYWPTAQAKKDVPAVAEGMARSEKIVFSKTLKRTSWENVRVTDEDPVAVVRKLKQTEGPDMCILGSGTITAQLAGEGLIDEYALMIDPVALGEGTPIFKGMGRKLDLKLKSSKAFSSGVILAVYINL